MAESNWDLIKIYGTFLGLNEQDKYSHAKIKEMLQATDPEKLRQAGESFLSAAKLVGGERDGLQGALWRTASNLSTAWHGKDAAEAQTVLRALHATAAQLHDAMKATGETLKKYAEALGRYRNSVPNGILPQSEQTGLNSDATYTAPVFSGVTTADSPTGLLADQQAREHLRKLNEEIGTINLGMPEGLSWNLPDIEPLDFTPERPAKQVTVDESGAPKTGSGSTWNPGSSGGPSGGSSGGSSGSDSGGASGGGTGSGSGSGSPDGGTGQQTPGDKPGPTTPETPGNEQPPDKGTEPPKDTETPDKPQETPPVIGATDPPQPGTTTELADANPWTTPTQTGVTTTPDALPQTTGYRQTTPLVTTPFPMNSDGVIGRDTSFGYGRASTSGGEAPGVLRGGAGGSSGSMFPFMPGGGAFGEGGDENTREIYDPEGDVFSVRADGTSPERIG